MTRFWLLAATTSAIAAKSCTNSNEVNCDLYNAYVKTHKHNNKENTMADKIFRVNMTDLTTSIEDVPADWAGHGGRGLTSTIVAAEVIPTCHPLGAQQQACFCAGSSFRHNSRQLRPSFHRRQKPAYRHHQRVQCRWYGSRSFLPVPVARR